MLAALNLARRGLGRVWPNPAVGCVVVKQGAVIGRGWTQPGGRPHAETEALARAGAEARGATAYVSLEPCAHHGKTPPCADALVTAGVARVVAAMEDPDRRVSGRGFERLRRGGVDVSVGVCAEEAADMNAGFFSRILEGRPLITLKTATTLDGMIATHDGESQWITGEHARRTAHMLRATHDAVMIGSGTALADDPRLDCRLPGMHARSPVRIVIDGRLRLPLTSALVRDARELPTWIVTIEGNVSERIDAYRLCGVEIIETPAGPSGTLDLAAALQALAKRGLTRILVEGGATLTAALMQARLVDRVVWFRASSIIGGDGIPVSAPFGVAKLDQAPRFVRRRLVDLAGDALETYVRAR